jgi:hypothetical protein
MRLVVLDANSCGKFPMTAFVIVAFVATKFVVLVVLAFTMLLFVVDAVILVANKSVNIPVRAVSRFVNKLVAVALPSMLDEAFRLVVFVVEAVKVFVTMFERVVDVGFATIRTVPSVIVYTVEVAVLAIDATPLPTAPVAPIAPVAPVTGTY